MIIFFFIPFPPQKKKKNILFPPLFSYLKVLCHIEFHITISSTLLITVQPSEKYNNNFPSCTTKGKFRDSSELGIRNCAKFIW